MILIYEPTSEPFDSRRAFLTITAPGCVPGMVFEMGFKCAQKMPPSEEWPQYTGNADALFNSGTDHRFILSELVRTGMNADVFGQSFARARPRAGRSVLAAMLLHRRRDPESSYYFDAYIDAAKQVRIRTAAHRILREIDETP